MLESDTPSKTFLGVRFCLFGFDSIDERQVRVKLIGGGGVGDSQNCTHVIVDKIVYDDPICVAARNDGKTVVTGLWVDHSFDIGMAVDATSVMYQPLRDLNGIPGAENLIICLTGYQRQDRDDIMTMVSLMGAQFSKPLVANKVTHLICYKFEGEKYELAKKIRKIKLVNHRWLEDCLREWELLPEANYSKSGYELEMMEAEAKDSEEEAEETTSKQSGQKSLHRSPHNLKSGILSSNELPKSAVKPTSSMPRHSPNTKETSLMPGKSHEATSFNNFDVPQLHAFQDSGVLRNATPAMLADRQQRSPKTMEVLNNLASTSKSPSLSDEKFTAISYTRKKSPVKSTLPNLSGEKSGNSSGSPQATVLEDVPAISSSKMQQPEERISSFIESPWKGSDLRHGGEDSAGILPQKRTLKLSSSSPKLQKMSHDAKASIKGSALETEWELQTNNGTVYGTGSQNIVQNSSATDATKSVSNDPSSLTLSAEDRQNNTGKKSPDMSCRGYRESTLTSKPDMQNQNEKSPQTSIKGLREPTSASRPSIGDSGLGRCVEEVGDPQHQQQDVEFPSFDDRKLEMENSHNPATLDMLEGGSDKLVGKPLSKKTLGKKTLGSRPKQSNIANRKGSIYSNKTASEIDSTACLTVDKGKANYKSAGETSPSAINIEAAKDVVEEVVTKTQDATVSKTQFMDDETQAPDEEDEKDTENTLGKEKSELVEMTGKADTVGEMEHVRQDFKVDVHGNVNATDGTDPERAAGSQNSELAESSLKHDGLKTKASKRKKQVSGKAKMRTVPSESENELVREDNSVGKNAEEKDDEKENSVPHPVAKTNRTKASSKVENSLAAEKTSPIGCKEIACESVVKPKKKTVKTKNISQKVKSSTQPAQKVVNRLNSDPVCFILSGHKLQRKEFQQVIRRLKGKFCRDSHQWSYQATHFIAPDPIRRTEKFFAAAASGRWILKTDYLSACNQAGKFLAEESYEWHKNGLSEDGAINLEAPRKWRELRERTGHGAFYGLRIIVYGECIAPPLDTLKRVVKAGDGTILATSPPYTKFLNSGVDYAVVSPGMPRVDIWVQEFLKHEIPCVVADYLVEYVCKPGYSLERHVLYNTHEWAEISFNNLRSRAEEVVLDSITPTPISPENSPTGSDGVACQVCGSTDRGEVMLICGDESGSVGCGVGTHIDCCDPPFQDIPEDDWLCPNCSKTSKTRKSATSPKKRKKGTSQSKGK
ncbi:hypothetical protein CCACVL1_22146 [Corchorus capsularis]|uniref:BRCT domain-containing protein n=1 Tax=Corchorus capsularis TaxID=210143 RepID=A0A1R3H0X3_COCAP|nr:hypothetical protein CCACVL1_22146 [Corchorus capsularis]